MNPETDAEVTETTVIDYTTPLAQIQQNQQDLFLILCCICFFLALLVGILFAKVVWRKF